MKKLKKSEFNYLMSFAKHKTVVMTNSEIILQNNPFEELILVERIPPSKDVYLLTEGQKIHKCIEFEWIGSLEAVAFMKTFRTGKMMSDKQNREEKYLMGDRWGISVKIEGKPEDDESITYFKWEKEDL